jgi:hypothetical protein
MPSPARSRFRLFRVGAAAAFSVAVLAIAVPVRAHPEYPEVVDATLGLTCVPPCTLCHASPQGGGAASTPFGLNVMAAFAEVGLMSGMIQPNSDLPGALRRIQQAPCPNTTDKSCSNPMMCGVCDGDGTGESDVLELQANQNPNNSGSMPCVEYGCGAHVAPERKSRPLDGTAALFALCAALVLARRFRR